MTAAYASFANEGVWREARTYTVVKDANGQIILDNTQDSHVAMKDMTAWYITDMLETDVYKRQPENLPNRAFLPHARGKKAEEEKDCMDFKICFQNN